MKQVHTWEKKEQDQTYASRFSPHSFLFTGNSLILNQPRWQECEHLVQPSLFCSIFIFTYHFYSAELVHGGKGEFTYKPKVSSRTAVKDLGDVSLKHRIYI